MSTDANYDIVFYDGECGLCHRLVRFILTRDKKVLFRFAPLQGQTFDRSVTLAQRAVLPDSVFLLTTSGELLLRSEAALYVLRRLGGFHRLMAGLLRLFPQRLRDWFYDFVARRRKGWFAQPEALCPIVPEQLRPRFLP